MVIVHSKMTRFLCLYLLIIVLANVHGFLNVYPKLNVGLPSGDAGEPLFLTPYIESGKIKEAQQLARVPFTETLKIKSYSGFFTVNKEYNSNLFVWFFPAQIPDSSSAPVIVWLQGGPGATSLFGLFAENGPIKVRHGKFERRKYTWASNHNVLYIDNPVGTGFSFTNDNRGYCVNETQVGEDLYTTLEQFFQLFPKLQKNKFFVTGESYAGKYVPALAYTIHKKNLNNPKVRINLKGIAIGNGLSDPLHQLAYGRYLHQIGLIDTNGLMEFHRRETLIAKYIKEKKYADAFVEFDSLLNGDLVQTGSLFTNLTGFNFYFNYLHSKDYIPTEFGNLVGNTAIRRAIHVGNRPFNNGTMVEIHLLNDVMKSVAPLVSELLDHYYVVVYNGQLDIIVAYPLTVNYLENLNFTGSEDYKTAKRYMWKVDNDVAGYVKQAGKLVEIMVRNAGHMVPADQPKWALDLITRFTHEKTFYHKEP